MRTKSDSEHPLRELSKEEIEALVAEMGPIEVPEGPLTNSGRKYVIQVDTITADELSIKNHAKRGKACEE